jgi:hypothetical protein
MNYSWIRKEFLRHKVDDIAEFIRADLLNSGFTEIPADLDARIKVDVDKFMKNPKGTEIWFCDNGETLSHTNGFVKMKDGEIVDWMPLWQS